MLTYQPPWYLSNGLLQTIATSYWYGTTWSWWGEKVPWLSHLPLIPWKEQVFTGADGVPIWGMWSCPSNAKATLIITYGITGQARTAWYAHILARKAYNQGWAVLIYDWRGHGKTAELSPVPSSDGWREGEDQLKMAAELVIMGCPNSVALAGLSLGGQLTLWGLKTAVEKKCSLIKCGAVLCPNLESNRSLEYLLSSPAGRAIEQTLANQLRKEALQRLERFPNAVKPDAVKRVNSIRTFDQYMVIDYYGFSSVSEYYQKTSSLYLLDDLDLPYLVVYAEDDPLFDPQLIPELRQKTEGNPYANLILTAQGGHIAHIGIPTAEEDEFWGLNRLLEFCKHQINGNAD
jgi:uncharacterized protein